MPMYMDRHEAGELTPTDIYAAHLLDLQVQEKYHTRYLTYWMDQERGHVFCLVDAPSREAAAAVHAEAHGEIANEIIEVEQDTIAHFLGRLNDPPGTSSAQPIADSAFRIVLFTDIEGSTRLTQAIGDDGAMAVLREHDTIVRTALRDHGGSEVKHTGDGIMASFVSVTKALASSVSIQRAFMERNRERGEAVVRVRVGMSAGEPVCEHGDLFGAVVQLARRICDAAEPATILTSNPVRELCIGKPFSFTERGEMELKGFDAPVRVHELAWLH
ncbi:MAG: nickel-binding protein [Dehalococcoidia bacterium]